VRLVDDLHPEDPGGDAPETIEAYSKQQLRWATDGFKMMVTHN
jgi:hypothetical protein